LRRDDRDQTEERQARREATEAALERLDELAKDPAAPRGLVERLRAGLGDKLKRLDSGKGGGESAQTVPEEVRRVYQGLVDAQREALIRLRDENVIGDEVLHRIESELDFEELRLGEEDQKGE